MKLIEVVNNRLKQKVTSLKDTIILGFFVGFGIISNIIPPEAVGEIGNAGFLFVFFIGITFWGIGFNFITMSLSDLTKWILKSFFNISIDKEKLFILIAWSNAPFALGGLTGMTRMLDRNLDVGIYAFSVLTMLSVLALYLNISEIRKKGISMLGKS